MQSPCVQQWCSEDVIVGQRAQPLCLGVEGQRNRNGADVAEVQDNLLGWHLSSYPDELGKLPMHLLAFFRVNFLKDIFLDMALLGLVLGWWCFLVHQDLV